MAILIEGKHAGEFLLSEGNGTISRESVVIAAAAGAIAAGTLLGKITASGKYVAYSNVAADGSQTAVGIAYDNIDDLATDQKATIIARDAEVTGASLVGLDAPGTADLALVGIIVR